MSIQAMSVMQSSPKMLLGFVLTPPWQTVAVVQAVLSTSRTGLSPPHSMQTPSVAATWPASSMQAASVMHSAPSSRLKALSLRLWQSARAHAGSFFHITDGIFSCALLAFAVACGNMAGHILAGFVRDAVRAQQAVGAGAVSLALVYTDAGSFFHIAHGHVSCAGLAVASFVYELIADMARQPLSVMQERPSALSELACRSRGRQSLLYKPQA